VARRTKQIRNEFMHLTARIEFAPSDGAQNLRHTFATVLQDANVDPPHPERADGARASVSTVPSWASHDCRLHPHAARTKRQQLERAWEGHRVVQVAEAWLQRQEATPVQSICTGCRWGAAWCPAKPVW